MPKKAIGKFKLLEMASTNPIIYPNHIAKWLEVSEKKAISIFYECKKSLKAYEHNYLSAIDFCNWFVDFKLNKKEDEKQR